MHLRSGDAARGLLRHRRSPRGHPTTGWIQRWEADLGLGEVLRRLGDVFRASSVGGVTEAEVHDAVARRLRLDAGQVDRFMADLWDEYLGSPNTELIEWFAAPRPRHRTGIISNSGVGAREREQERYGFVELTDAIVYSHEVGMAKPDPGIYRLACARLGVSPEEAVLLDDVEGAVAGARAVGMSAVLFRDNAQAVAELEALLAE